MPSDALPETWLLCPSCGRAMSTIQVAIATPPFQVDLIGCEICGITTNELRTPPTAHDPKPETDPSG